MADLIHLSLMSSKNTQLKINMYVSSDDSYIDIDTEHFLTNS